jgi:uncharacterized protein YodC (DUF2158 family)
MTMNTFKAGTVVQLKSGGPKMVVIRQIPLHDDGNPNEMSCSWFDSAQTLTHCVFPTAALVEDDLESPLMNEIVATYQHIATNALEKVRDILPQDYSAHSCIEQLEAVLNVLIKEHEELLKLKASLR